MEQLHEDQKVTHFQIPPDQSILAIRHVPPIENGDIFEEDFWIYGKDKKKKRKWFVPLFLPGQGSSDHIIWPGKLQDISTLELKRWNCYQRCRRILDPLYYMLEPKIRAAGRFGGQGHFGNVEGFVEFNQYKYPEGVSWNWMEPIDSAPDHINQLLVDEWFDYERLMFRNNQRLHLFQVAFLMSIQKQYHDIEKQALHLIINGRHYWFEWKSSGFSIMLRKLAYPEDIGSQVIEQCIGS